MLIKVVWQDPLDRPGHYREIHNNVAKTLMSTSLFDGSSGVLVSFIARLPDLPSTASLVATVTDLASGDLLAVIESVDEGSFFKIFSNGITTLPRQL